MKNIVLLSIRFYKRWISPMTRPTCRFYPSCSSYMMEAVEVHGALSGVWMGVRRILRCHPYHPGGHDPVPPLLGHDHDADCRH